MKTEMPNIVDKKFQTLIKACLGMCINSNLHLEMFHIWTLNVLMGKKQIKNIQMLSWNNDNNVIQIQSN